MTTDKIEWVKDLPSKRLGMRGRTLTFIETLKTRPGVWAVYERRAANKNWTGKSLYESTYKGTEWATRKSGGKTVVYARWVGKTPK